MSSALARLPYATLAPAAVAATVFATALGSSSVSELGRVGRPLRWLALAGLLLVAAAWVASRRERLRVPPGVVAAAAWFVALCAASALWSVRPQLTEERAISLAVVIAAAGLAAQAAAGLQRAAERLLYGVLAGAAAVALAGLPLLAVDHSAAVRPASVGVPARYQGLGESPNTVALLLALAVPLAVWVALERHRLAGLGLLALFAGSIAASASRGGIVGAAAGASVVVLLHARSVRAAVLLLAATAAVAAAAVGVGRLAQPGKAPAATPAPASHPRPGYADVEAVFPLADDVGRSLPGRGDVQGARTLLGSSGRTAVWGYAMGQVLERPVAGYGFGTEEHVFVDRFANFEGGHVENSYIGLMLQLGVVGLASLVLLVGAAAAAGRRALRGRGFGAAAAGALAAGLVVALVQSYVYSAGNVATLTFWLAAALTAVAAVAPREAA